MYPFYQHFLLCLGFFLYIPAATVAVVHLLRRGDVASRSSQGLAVAALLAHVALLILRGVETGGFPVLTALDSLILFLVALTAAVLLLGRFLRMPVMVSFALPVITAITGGSFLLVQTPAEVSSPHPLLLASHVSLTVISYAAFTLGFVLGLMYLLQERQLKSRRPGRLLYLLPALDVMEMVSVRTIVAGWAMLTVGIVLGMAGLYLSRASLPPDVRWHTDPKVVWTGLTWIAYTGVVVIQWMPRFRGRRVAMVGVLGFGFVLFTYFGAHLLGEGFHRF